MWTDERVEAVKKLWSEGLSASQIAHRIGYTTRNAVIGKVSRLGLPGRKVAVRRPANDRYNTEDRRMERGDRPFKQAVKATKPNWRAEPLPDTPATDVATITSILDLEAHHCRWPIGDPKQHGFGYCGCQKVEGLPYCNAHARRSYTAPEAKPNPAGKARPFFGHVGAVMNAEATKHANAQEFAES